MIANRVCRCGESLEGTHRNRKFCSSFCVNKDRYIRTGQRSSPEQRALWYKRRCVKDGYRKMLRLQGREMHERVMEFVREYKLENGCSRCGYAEHHVALDFDHINGEKKLNISSTKSISQAKLEMKKCQVLCSNCHRIVTYDRARGINPYKPKISEMTYDEVNGE